MDNLYQVIQQIRDAGIVLNEGGARDDVTKIRTFVEGKKTTFGKGGKAWFKFYRFQPRAGGEYITGGFGSYKPKDNNPYQKIEQDWAPLSEAERERVKRERMLADERAAREKEESKRVAQLKALDLWREASPTGVSPYLVRKGLEGEACRYMPDGTLVILMLRYDLPRELAVQAAQRIAPNGEKKYSYGFSKPGCSLRLGTVDDATQVILIVEGYATGLTVRQATDRRFPVYVAFDAGNLAHVVPLVRELHPGTRIVVCADDDWQTRDQLTGKLSNPGRTAAKAIAKQVEGVDLIFPVFDRTRQKGDTDFDDLRIRQGLDVVARQLKGAIAMMERVYG